MKPIAIIPARGGSKRFPRKNIALLNEKPLISYGIKAALESSLFDRVIVSTEDEEIANIAKSYGADVFDRHPDFASDTAHELDACIEVINSLDRKPDYFCVVYPTAVQVQSKDLKESYELVKKVDNPCVVMAVSAFNYHPFKTLITDENGRAEIMFPKQIRQQSQSYPKTLASNGMFYWLNVQELLQNKHKEYYQDNLYCYEIPTERAIDIDAPEDLKLVELMLNIESRS